MRFIPLLAAMLAITGCASPSSTPTSSAPEIKDLGAILTQPLAESARPTSPLLPSAFFANGADAFVAWRCMPAQDLIAAFPDNELRLWSAQGHYRLDPAVVASGARYVKGDLSFWDKGREAIVESRQGRLECQRDVSRETITRDTRPESIFFAKGNEPGWLLMLDRQSSRLRLVADYGAETVELPYRVESLSNGQAAEVLLRSTDAEQPLQARLQAKACFDSMSGMPYPVHVSLQWQGRTLRGCGQGVEAL